MPFCVDREACAFVSRSSGRPTAVLSTAENLPAALNNQVINNQQPPFKRLLVIKSPPYYTSPTLLPPSFPTLPGHRPQHIPHWRQRTIAALGRNEYHSFIMGFGAALCRLFCVSTPAESHSIQDSTPTTQSRCVSFVGQHPATTTRYDVCQVTSINMLHDDVLLDIFDFYVIGPSNDKKEVEAWQTLVHVRRQWRTVVFGSPLRLDLRLYSATKTRMPVDVWPALPLRIQRNVGNRKELDHTIAVLERSNRVYFIFLADIFSLMEDILPAMQKPFPELTYLCFFSTRAATVVPDSFLGGSAPRLEYLNLSGIPFPG